MPMSDFNRRGLVPSAMMPALGVTIPQLYSPQESLCSALQAFYNAKLKLCSALLKLYRTR
jgi:hypothetical protein